MIKAKSLYHLILYSIIFIIVLTSSFAFIIISNTFNEFQEKIKLLEHNYTKKQKDLIKLDIKKTIEFIHTYNIKYKDTKSKKELKEYILHSIELIHNKNNINTSIYIYDFNSKLIYAPKLTKNKENIFSKFPNSNSKIIINKLIDISRKNDGEFLKYHWKQNTSNTILEKISYSLSYDLWEWTIIADVYLDEMDKLLIKKEKEYDEKISNYILQILSLTVMLILYSLFLYRNITILIVNDVKAIGNYFKEYQKTGTNNSFNKIKFGEFKVVANFGKDMFINIKDKNNILKDLNKHLEDKVTEKTQELTNLIHSQKQFLKNSVHEINTPLSIIQTNIDLLRRHIPNNKYVTNIENGSKIIQNIYDSLSFLIKKDKVIYLKEYINFSSYLKERIDFFQEIAKANLLNFEFEINEDIYIKFNIIQLQRIIDNNLSNAIKYSNAKSTIYIHLNYYKKDRVEFYVKTSSSKIKSKEEIFNGYYRENSSRGGFGLGLKIVKDICDKNFVTITLYSSKKETKFIYRFKINENIVT